MSIRSFRSSRSSSRSTDSIDKESVESEGAQLPTIASIYHQADKYNDVLGYTGVVQVEQDLTPSEKAEIQQVSKLQAAWGPDLEEDGVAAEQQGNNSDSSSEHTSASEHASTENTSIADDVPTIATPIPPTPNMATPMPKFYRPASMDQEMFPLEPKEIVQLLINEFGTLANEDERPERLVLESDAVFFNGVVILGVMHITTHRIAFHASLLASDQRPTAASQTPIKASGVTVHRRGWHTKRRVWLELYPDMLVSCNSSSEHDRLRPIRTIFLSHVKNILLDPDFPCAITFVLNTHDVVTRSFDYAEFDTPESALEWRREIMGALYLHSHRKRDLLDQSSDGGDSGIRISCPLQRIERTAMRTQERSLSFSSFYLNSTAEDPMNVLHLAPVTHISSWSKIDDLIVAAKERQPLTQTSIPPLIIDFGPLNVTEGNHKPVSYADEKEALVRKGLALEDEGEVWIQRARLFRTIACSGYFTISTNLVGYLSRACPRKEIQYRIPISKIRSAKPFRSFPIRHWGLTIEVIGQGDIKFQFKTQDLRDEAAQRINSAIVAVTDSPRSRTPERSNSNRSSVIGILSPHSRALAVARASELPFDVKVRLPKVINIEPQFVGGMSPMHFVCLTIGSRGDVQPYIALGLGLMKEQHKVTIVTHEEYKDWIESFGIAHRSAGGDPGALMKLSVENKMFSPEFFKESLQNFRPWLDQLLIDSWEACQDADVLIESPSAMAGVHIAEALNIPYFRAFTMPWTLTSEFPHAFLSPPVEYSTFNRASYVLFTNVMWAATSGQINSWRKKYLSIASTDMGHLAQSQIPFIYNFSQAVVPKPMDWSDSICVSGYWFLDDPDPDWTPPASLKEWMAKARADNKPIVYIGFGSITVPHPNRVSNRIIQAVLKSGVRAIVSKGWSARMSSSSTDDDEAPEFPPECYALDKVPHDWLFPRVDAALHHGGAGTTGASLRAGIPTLIKPWFGDQYFWASRVQKLGAGLRVPSLSVNDLSEALTKATTSRAMKEKAAAAGEKIRSEDGVRTAIHNIYTYLPRAGQDRRKMMPSRSASIFTRSPCPVSPTFDIHSSPSLGLNAEPPSYTLNV